MIAGVFALAGYVLGVAVTLGIQWDMRRRDSR